MPGFVIVDIKGKKLTEEEISILKHPAVAGVNIFFKNVDSPEQLKALTESIQAIRSDIQIPIAMFVDREGGNVQRLQKPKFRSLPAARCYGEMWDQTGPMSAIKMTKHFASIAGNELVKENIRHNLAPLLDLHTNSDIIGSMDRAFHADPKAVALLGEAFIDGLHEAGITATAKHFPGHGVCEEDSHVKKPISDIPLEELEKTHLFPFIELIKKGKIDGIMPAHITFTKVDPENTVGFSAIWLQEILRKKYGFKGLIISDCLSMTGADIGSPTERGLKALHAGCDMIIMCDQERPLLLKTLEELSKAYKPTIESQARIIDFLETRSELEKKLRQDVVEASPVAALHDVAAASPMVALSDSAKELIDGKVPLNYPAPAKKKLYSLKPRIMAPSDGTSFSVTKRVS